MNFEGTVYINAGAGYVLMGKASGEISVKGFTDEQKEQIQRVLFDIPMEFKGHIKRIIANPNLGAKHGRYLENGTIFLNPRDFANKVEFGWNGHKIPHIDLTLAHEVGHGVYLGLSEEDRALWRKLSGWKSGRTGPQQAPPYKEKRPGWPKETSDMTHRKGVGFTRHYAERNDHEDFADSFGFYVMGQKKRLPLSKLAFMDRVFIGLRKKG